MPSRPAVENGQLAARARSGLVDARGVDAVLLLLHDLLLSAFNTLQAIGTTHLCPALCDVPALILVFSRLTVLHQENYTSLGVTWPRLPCDPM